MAIVRSDHRVDGKQVKIKIEMDGALNATAAAEPEDPYGATRGAVSQVLESAHDYFAEGMGLARACAASVVENLTGLSEQVRPDEFEVKLAIKLDAEAGAILTKLGAEAQLEVSLKWTAKKKA